MKNPLKRSSPEQEYFSQDMAMYLMQNHNVKPEEAFHMANDFYKRHKNKLKNALKLQ
jgi:hypothetical protein